MPTLLSRARRPRLRRAPEPPPFRVTDDDVAIVRQLARHRFLRSAHIAALVGHSLDRTNDRLSRLFHAGYLDQPRAQLDRFPVAGSSHFMYALADRGARIMDFYVSLQCAALAATCTIPPPSPISRSGSRSPMAHPTISWSRSTAARCR
jgi:hypothetical protein